jgi:hypothetical protein
VNESARKRRAKRRAQHAQTNRRAREPEASCETPERGTLRRLWGNKPDGRLGLGRKLVVVLVTAGVGAAIGPALTSGQPAVWGALAGATFALAVLSTVAGVVWLRPRWGTAASVAIISLAWAAAGIALALLPPACPGSVGGTRCGVSETATYAMIGALTPLSVVMLILPLLTVQRASVWVWRRWGPTPHEGRRNLLERLTRRTSAESS